MQYTMQRVVGDGKAAGDHLYIFCPEAYKHVNSVTAVGYHICYQWENNKQSSSYSDVKRPCRELKML